jgi:hypothetical protein
LNNSNRYETRYRHHPQRPVTSTVIMKTSYYLVRRVTDDGVKPEVWEICMWGGKEGVFPTYPTRWQAQFDAIALASHFDNDWYKAVSFGELKKLLLQFQS